MHPPAPEDQHRPAATATDAVNDSRSTAGFRAWGPDEVHLWSIATDDEDGPAGSPVVLDRAEQARADRFRFERDRVRFVRSHAFTRRILARYLDLDAASVPIRASASGKPRLEHASGISFNTSRDDGLSVVVVAPGSLVGVDVERLRPVPDAMDIAQELYAEPEIELLAAVPREERSRVFLALWTRKESFVKAVGGGLSIALDRFSMTGDQSGDSGRVAGPMASLPFAFRQFDDPRGYIGAVTAEGTQVSIRRGDTIEAVGPSRHGGDTPADGHRGLPW